MPKGTRGGKRNTSDDIDIQAIHAQSVAKIAGERTLINSIIQDVLRYEEYHDPAVTPLSRSDIQGMVESYSAQHNYSFDDEETLQDRVDTEMAVALADHAELKRIEQQVRTLQQVIRATPNSRANVKRQQDLQDLNREWARLSRSLNKYNYLLDEDVPF